MVNKKKKKVETMSSTNGGGGEGEGRDLISKLPDSILHYILSFLDMTTVFETIFLSKRWRYLWTTQPFLNFNDKDFYSSCSRFSQNGFMVFVDRVLIFRDQSSSVQSFSFSHGGGGSKLDIESSSNDYIIHSHIFTSMHILIRSNVQVIDLRINSSYLNMDSFKLPMSLFTCKSLTTLKLDFTDDDDPQSYPRTRFELSAAAESFICLPSLKTLHLKSLLVDNSVELLISSSPVLETLIISNCISSNQEFNISNPQINKLLIHMFMAPSLEYRIYEPCDIKLFAPKMTSFSCIDKGVLLEHLELSVWLLELMVTQFPERLEINPFRNLYYLQLKTSFSKHQIGVIMYLIEKCPELTFLALKVTNHRLHKSHAQWIKDEDSEAEMAPQCIMHRLRDVRIFNAVVGVNQFEFLKFLLKNAVVLDRMMVFTSKEQQLDDDKNKRFRECIKKLKSFHRASTSSIIVFDNVW